MMNNSIQHLAENILLIASPQSWIESNAIQQLTTTAKLPEIRQAVGLPDLHAGRGYPIGAAFFSVGKVYPALIGSDIGCGMALWQTSYKSMGLNLSKLEKRIGSLDKRLEIDEILQIYPTIQPIGSYGFAEGTIGLGNHFAELLIIDQIYDKQISDQIELNKSHLQLLIHSGSRGIGGEILRQHINQFGHNGLLENSIEFEEYRLKHQQAMAYAKQNRELIALRIFHNLRTTGQCLTDLAHNFLEPAIINGEQGWLHRKGAAPSNQGLVVIPGSRGSYSYLVKPRQTELALYSLAHGAGRKWKRSDCKDRLSAKFKQEHLVRTELGSRVICKSKDLLYEEAPQAYKNIEQVIQDLETAGLIEKVARFKPILTYKLGEKTE